MLPVVAPIKSVINQMWFHSLAMAVVSLLVIQSAQLPIWLSVITLLLIAGWKRQLIKLTRQPSEVNAGKLFQASIVFLSIYSFLLVIQSAQLPIWLSVITLLLIAGWKRQLIKLTRQPSEVNAGKLFQASIVFLSIYSFLLVIGVLLK